MSVKRTVKTLMLGKPGNRARSIRMGLLKGLKFRVDTASQSMRLVGLAEREIAADVRRLAAASKSALDIGSHDGWYSLYFAAQPNMTRVLACDASADRLAEARDNFSLNPGGLLDKVAFVEKFIGAESKEGWTSVDALCQDLPEPILLKIDVDGGEMDVLRGAERTLTQRRCSAIIETHTPELEEQCVQTLERWQFKCRIVDNGWYRIIVREGRPIPHNRWMVAEKGR